jgi:hypothetical protein
MKTALFVSVFVVLLSVTAFLQSPTYRVEFTPSPEHALIEHGVPVVSSYEVKVFAPGVLPTGTPATVVNIGKPAISGTMVVADVSQPMLALPASSSCVGTAPPPTSCYTAVINTIGPGGRAESAVGAPFPLVPRAPGASGVPAVRR